MAEKAVPLDKNARVTVSIPESVLAQIDDIAAVLGYSRSAMIASMLTPMADLYSHSLSSFSGGELTAESVKRFRGESRKRLEQIALVVDPTRSPSTDLPDQISMHLQVVDDD